MRRVVDRRASIVSALADHCFGVLTDLLRLVTGLLCFAVVNSNDSERRILGRYFSAIEATQKDLVWLRLSFKYSSGMVFVRLLIRMMRIGATLESKRG
jgi:hypothetical protein